MKRSNNDFEKSDEKGDRSRLRLLLIDNDGFSDYTSYLARGLAKYHEIIFCGFSNDSYIATGAVKEKKIKFYNMMEKLPKGYSTSKGIMRIFLLFFTLIGILTKTDYNIVHIQELLPMFFFFIPLLRLRRKKIFWTLHDIKIFSPSKGIRGKLRVLFLRTVCQPGYLTKYADSIIVHANSLKKQLEVKGIKEGKIHVIPHFDYRYLLDPEKPLTNPENKIVKKIPQSYILFFGDIAPWKGIDVLVNAAKIVRQKFGETFNLLIAGRSFYEDQDVSYYEQLGTQEHQYIHMYNKWITKSEIPDIFSKSLFLVLPYTAAFKHSASGVIPLAYTFSKPVIVSNVDSLTEYVEHGKTGFVFETGNSKQLADYIIELLENSSKCEDMGKNAFQKLLREMSVEKCCETLNELYRNSI